MARLRDAKRHPDRRVPQPFRQVQDGLPAVVPAVGQTVALAVGPQGLAGGPPKLFPALGKIACLNLPLGIFQHLQGEASVLFDD